MVGRRATPRSYQIPVSMERVPFGLPEEFAGRGEGMSQDIGSGGWKPRDLQTLNRAEGRYLRDAVAGQQWSWKGAV